MTKFKKEMDKARQLYKPHSTGTKKQSGVYGKEIMERLWKKMLSFYGRQWEASYGHVDGEVYKDWSAAIANLSVEQIKTGLDEIAKEGNEFPPNLIKFMRLCRTSTSPSFVTFNSKALPPPDISKRPKVVAAKEKHFKQVQKLYGKQPK